MDDVKRKARTTYNAAAEFFDDPALTFWDRFGRATIDRLELRRGASVLDVCAGSGASAIPAAERVGPSGCVIAVDLAEKLLALARSKADDRGLSNLLTRHGDLEALNEPDESFDAVVVVFGIFFLPDMASAITRLWRLVGPGGRLAVTTWGPRLFEPANSVFWDAVATRRPDLVRSYQPWDALIDPQAVHDLLTTAGVTNVSAELVAGTHSLHSPDDFWRIVLGSGYRATHDALEPDEQHAVRAHTLSRLGKRFPVDIETNVIYAQATKPASAPRTS